MQCLPQSQLIFPVYMVKRYSWPEPKLLKELKGLLKKSELNARLCEKRMEIASNF